MAVTLHVDLLDTHLRDFDTHWWRGWGLFRAHHFFQGASGLAIIQRLETKPSLEGWEYSWASFPAASGWIFNEAEYDEAAASLERAWSASADWGYFLGRKRVTSPAGMVYATAILASRPPNQKRAIPHNPPSKFFVLYVARYRRDRLRLIVNEGDPQGHSARAFWAWLRPRWGDAIVELAVKDAPSPPAGALPRTPPVPPSDDYTWDDVFDWWYRGGKLLGYPTLKSLASTGIGTEGTIKNNHSRYKDEFGTAAMPDYLSKFAGMVPLVTNGHGDDEDE